MFKVEGEAGVEETNQKSEGVACLGGSLAVSSK